jgi:hypothetical protein
MHRIGSSEWGIWWLFPYWIGSVITDRLEVTVSISVNEQVAGHRVTVRPRAEPRPANVVLAVNAAGNLRSVVPKRLRPRYEPTWRRPSPLPSGQWDSRPSAALGRVSKVGVSHEMLRAWDEET